MCVCIDMRPVDSERSSIGDGRPSFGGAAGPTWLIGLAGIAVAIAILVGVLLLRPGTPDSIVAPAAATTAAASLEAPGVHLVLRAQFVVDESSATCRGSGDLEGVGEGAIVEVHDDFQPVRSTIPTLTLPGGVVVAASDDRGGLLVPPGDDAACVFDLPPLGYALADHERVALSVVAAADAPLAMVISGNDVVYTLGRRPFDPVRDLSADGVADPDPEVWTAEIEFLRGSASPGRIFGMILLGGESTGAPTSPAQPVCVGVGAFGDIRPGGPVVVSDGTGATVGEDILRGATFDAHHGCGHWFAVDVPADLDTYTIAIADHPGVVLEQAALEDVGWRVDLWSDPMSAQVNCVEADEPRLPMMCLAIEPPG
jgi:hypothetical protein